MGAEQPFFMPFSEFCDIIHITMSVENDLKLLRQVLHARSIPAAPVAFENEDAAALFNDLADVRNFLSLFARGYFDSEVTGRHTLAAALKSLQANLRHLTWQVQEVAKGDFTQRVDFMGEFSSAFNSMVIQLKQAIDNLKASEERWNLAIQCSRDGIWDINIDTRKAWYSDSFMQIMHYGHSDLPADLHWETKIHPDDITEARSMIDMLSGRSDIVPFFTECRFQTPQQDYVWVRIRGMPVRTGQERRLIAVASDITSQKEIETALMRQAMYDNLTGLPNRYLLNDRLKQLAAASDRTGKPFILATLDIDFFKEVNDTYGHAAGDLVLAELAKRLNIGLRYTDTAARLGGDEFVAIYPCETGCEQHTTELVMNRYYENLQPPVMIGDVEYKIRSSAGVAWFPKHAADLPELFACADTALYKAKKAGKNQYAVYNVGDGSSHN